jgi:hypothetical protein
LRWSTGRREPASGTGPTATAAGIGWCFPLAALARGGTVEVDEALAKAVDKPDLARRLGRSAG